MFALRSIVRPAARQVRAYQSGKGFVPAHMNELPVPQGSWKEAYNRRQTKYNATLAGGIVFALFSIYCARASGALYLNFSPPDTYE